MCQQRLIEKIEIEKIENKKIAKILKRLHQRPKEDHRAYIKIKNRDSLEQKLKGNIKKYLQQRKIDEENISKRRKYDKNTVSIYHYAHFSTFGYRINENRA